LIGDSCVDAYQFGTVNRISPEAPVPVFEPEREVIRGGMAANVFENLKMLGCEVTPMLGVGGRKTRLIDSRYGQQILRIDEDQRSPPIRIKSRIPQTYDAVVISDYNKGAVDYKLIREVRRHYVGPVFVDTKKPDLAKFADCFVKINEREYQARKTVNNHLIVTLGERGAEYHANGVTQCFPAHKVEVSDVCGAGDTFLAAVTYKYLSTGDISRSIEFALAAAAVTVQHLGVYAPTLEEINAIIG